MIAAKTMTTEINEIYKIRWVCLYSRCKIFQKEELHVVSHPLK